MSSVKSLPDKPVFVVIHVRHAYVCVFVCVCVCVCVCMCVCVCVKWGVYDRHPGCLKNLKKSIWMNHNEDWYIFVLYLTLQLAWLIRYADDLSPTEQHINIVWLQIYFTFPLCPMLGIRLTPWGMVCCLNLDGRVI